MQEVWTLFSAAMDGLQMEKLNESIKTYLKLI